MNKNKENDPVEEIAFYSKTGDVALDILQSDMNGLSTEEISRRQVLYGKNELVEGKKKSLFGMIIEQFKNLMVIVLLFAALISGLLQELTDTIIILIVVILNAVLGAIQERKTEKALDR